MSDLARELRDDYPAVDVTTVIFSAGFAGVGCCVIPQDRVLAVISELEAHADLVRALERLLAAFKGLQPFPLVVQAVAEGLIRDAESALAKLPPAKGEPADRLSTFRS